MEKCQTFPDLKVSARGVSTRAAEAGDDFEDVMHIVWRVVGRHPEVQKELEEALCEALMRLRERRTRERD